jgi:DNA polymerase (family 10)
MENLDVARVLEELADLLEIQGANPFRIRAYRNAVRTVEGLTRPLRLMVEEGEDLTALPAIGKDIAGHISELLETGRIGRLEEVAAQLPRSLVELMRLEGVGPKKARRLFEELDVRTVEGLAEALDRGQVEGLSGFGKKSAEKIVRAIEDHRKHGGRFLIDEAEKLIAGVLDHVRAAPGVERVEVAGSLRRRKETIGDIDLLALCEGDGSPVVGHFARYPGAERVEVSGSTKGNIVLPSGLSVDLRVIPRCSPGFRRSSGRTGARCWQRSRDACHGPSPSRTSGATSRCTPRGVTARPPWRKWPGPVWNRATSTWRSPTTPRRWPWCRGSLPSGPGSSGRRSRTCGSG